MGPETQSGLLALRCYRQANRHLCILGLVAWLSVGQCQEETRQDSKTSLLRNNRSYAYYSHQRCGSTCLPPPLDLVVQSEARSAAHRLWSLGSWSYLHPNRGHCRILLRLQQSDPSFSMGVDAMRPIYNFEPRFRVTVLTREDWAKADGSPPAVKGLVWFTDGSRMRGGPGLESMGNR